jgi:2',3'-cyclic-nucleotide 2'-phosphodiesterase (5'-nucleotidase family)
MTMTRALAALATCAALAAAGCGDSPEDTAHDNGKQVGQALQDLSNARSAQELQSAAQGLRDAVSQIDPDVDDKVRRQIETQRDSLNKAIGDLRTAVTSTDANARSTARTELQGQIQDLRSQAAAFRDSGDSVINAFWTGVKDGYND